MELLQRKGVQTVLSDGNRKLDVAALRKRAPFLKEADIVVGELTDDVLSYGAACGVKSGGSDGFADGAKNQGQGDSYLGRGCSLPITLQKGRLAAITGTNGKTTTTALTGGMLCNYFDDVRVVGNIGIPYQVRWRRIQRKYCHSCRDEQLSVRNSA